VTTGSLLTADLVIGVLAAAGWLGAGAAAAAGRRRAALGLGAGALVATLARAATIIALADAGWWFAADKVLVTAPLSVAAVVAAGPRLARPPAAVRSAAVPFLFAGYALSGALLTTVLHGYPVSAGPVLLAVAGVIAATTVSWRVLGPRPSRAMSRSAVVVAVAALVAGTGFAAHRGAAPAGPHEHASGAAPFVGEPTKRFLLTAATATVRVSGRDVAAWAFNGQVPGPELTATVGDVVEVTLRNRDITRGVTLHWHGYDVPNSQDGVPGMTQPAVLPGQQFVYRFRADQAGTYWYHTHAVSDVGVRKGLYGVLVVRPGPVSGVDTAVVVHTLAGRPLPAPAVEPVEAGVPVRLRLLNTDNTTHRYALAGAPFRVVAIDGTDLRSPTPLVNTAVLIPAGGRYDLAFAAAAAPVALFVDTRLVYSTFQAPPVTAAATAPAPGRVATTTARPSVPTGDVATSTSGQPTTAARPPTTTTGWPVLDPLTYGGGAPVPWPRFDRKFTLVLDRGLDLHGLLPRYAYTVNGATYPDIPDQVVHLGEIVEFTVVNRSAVVHPWHLHGHHVLVLSRNGEPSTGSPLWLDSFDVLPGDVWKVAFVADNPGKWVNHCHNLAHADAGMMLHLSYAESKPGVH
jgi:FtsP/CotA-like multicopper oxidase with cupredoxin domain